MDYKAYRSIRKQIDNPGFLHDDDDFQRMNKLYDAFLLGKLITKKHSMIQAAHKVASAAAAAPANNSTSNTSMSLSATSLVTSTSTSNKANKITASLKSTIPTSSGHSSTSSSLSLPSSNNNITRSSLDTNCMFDHSMPSYLHSVNRVATIFDTDLSIIVDTQAAPKCRRFAHVDLSNDNAYSSSHIDIPNHPIGVDNWICRNCNLFNPPKINIWCKHCSINKPTCLEFVASLLTLSVGKRVPDSHLSSR